MIFQQINLSTALILPLQNLVAKTPLPESLECLFDPQRSFGNPLRALFLKNRDLFCYGEIFVSNTRGPLGCLRGFLPSGPKPIGGNNKRALTEQMTVQMEQLGIIHVAEWFWDSKEVVYV